MSTNDAPAGETHGRLVLLLVDGLGWPLSQKLTSLQPLTRNKRGLLVKFIADPPTTTLQRLKGLLTGSMPTFVDAGANFGGFELLEDNLVHQWASRGRNVLFSGDDTWTELFPQETIFNKSDPQTSFNIRDLDSVDVAVKRFFQLHYHESYDVMIGHMLGIDHCGHTFGREHSEMTRKLGELDSFIREIVANLKEDDFLVIFGDHGMTSSGDHGGASVDEVEAALFLHCPKCHFDQLMGDLPNQIWQVDFVPLLAYLTNVAIPFSNLGVLQEFILPSHLKSEAARVCLDNFQQVARYVQSYEDTFGPIAELESYDLTEPPSKDCLVSGVQTLEAVREIFRERWTRFNLIYITFGISICCLSVFGLLGFPRISNTSKLAFTIFMGILMPLFIFFNVTSAEIFMIFSAFILLLLGLNFLYENRKMIKTTNVMPLVIGTIYSTIYFGNSFLIQEVYVTVFLLQTIVLINSIRLYLATRSLSKFLPSLLVLLLLRISLTSEQCREESPIHSQCFDPKLLEKCNLMFVLILLVIPLLALPKWLLHAHGNTLDHESRVFAKSSILRDRCFTKFDLIIVSLLAFAWISDNIRIHLFDVKTSLEQPSDTLKWALASPLFHHDRLLNIRIVCLRAGSLLALAGLVLLNLKPILIHILAEPGGVAGVTEYRFGSKTIYSSGTSTPFSGWLILNLQYVCYFLLSFLGPQSVSQLTLNMATGLLTIASVCECRFVCERMGGRDSHIMGRISRTVESWQLAIVCALLVQLSFFQIGAHQTTLTAIPWNAAFQMYSGSHGNNIVPALSVMLHLFSGPIILSACLPLSGFLFLLHQHADSQVSLELSLARSRHETSPLSASLHVLTKRILIVLLTWTIASLMATTVLRRHLMVWKIFAPRMLYMVLQTLFSCAFLVLNNLFLVNRVLDCVTTFTESLKLALTSQTFPH